jgi:hypothetical protein
MLPNLDYIASPGIDVKWTCLTCDSTLVDIGYGISKYDMDDIHPPYGSLADMERFIDECHARGMRTPPASLHTACTATSQASTNSSARWPVSSAAIPHNGWRIPHTPVRYVFAALGQLDIVFQFELVDVGRGSTHKVREQVSRL